MSINTVDQNNAQAKSITVLGEKFLINRIIKKIKKIFLKSRIMI